MCSKPGLPNSTQHSPCINEVLPSDPFAWTSSLSAVILGIFYLLRHNQRLQEEHELYFYFFNVFFLFFAWAHGKRKFLGQGLNLSSNLSHNSNDAASLTSRPPGISKHEL